MGPSMGRSPTAAIDYSKPIAANRGLIEDRLIHQAPRQRMDRPRRPEVLVLHHPHKSEVPDRIDPEPGSCYAEPAERPSRDCFPRGSWIHHDLKVHTPAGA